MGLRRRSTQATPPARSVPPSIIRASSCTRPSRVRKEPRPASKVSSSSITVIAASMASSAEPLRDNTAQPAASAFAMPRSCGAMASSGMAQAPPWIRRTGWRDWAGALIALESVREEVKLWRGHARHLAAFRLDIRVAHAMDHGDRRKHSEHPQRCGHRVPALEQRPKDNEHDALRPLHKPDLAGADQSFGARTGVAHHQRRRHDERHQEDVEVAVAARVEDEQAEEER